MSLRDRGRIGVIEDDPVMGGTLVHRLELEGYLPFWWRTGQEALHLMAGAAPDLVVCDIRLSDMTGEDVYMHTPPPFGRTPFLFVTAFGEIEQAVRLAKAGAVDYIIKPYEMPGLLQRIEHLVALQPRASGALGRSPAMREIEVLLRRVADLDSSLLLTGESGVGKEVAAHFVHAISRRATEPLVAINCAAIPNELIESQLFGHERGAFTSAQTRHHGYIERAGNGVLFLDEIGELPLAMQAKLLRVIDERAFTRVGGETVYKTSARLICATNSKLEVAVDDGCFRRDLYYRINVISAEIPSLRQRTEDILPLAHRFMEEFSVAFAHEVHSFTFAAEQVMIEHSWPGNVRELRNRVERAVALSQTRQIGVDLLFPLEKTELDIDALPTLSQVRDRAERNHIRAVLTGAGGRIDETAKILAVSRSTLFEKMRRLDIRSDAQRIQPG